MIGADFEKGDLFSNVNIVMEHADKGSLDKFMIEWKKVNGHE